MVSVTDARKNLDDDFLATNPRTSSLSSSVPAPPSSKFQEIFTIKEGIFAGWVGSPGGEKLKNVT